MPDYEMIINKCLNYIEKNLNKEILPEDICDYAGYSQFHFLRVFSSMTGYPLSSYIRNRRLSEAAKEIIETDDSIMKIARKYGFNRKEVFTRTFRNYFRTLPSSYRKNKNLIYYQPKIKLSGQQNKVSEGVKVNYKITDLPGLTVVGYKITTKTKDHKANIRNLWEKFQARLSEFPRDEKQLIVGVVFHDSRFVDRGPEPEEEWSYMAGIASTDELKVPEDMISHQITGCKYAVFTSKTTPEALCQTYRYIGLDWIKEVDYEFLPHEELELYDDRFKPHDPDNSFMDILVPIK